MIPEQVDLQALAAKLKQKLAHAEPVGYLRGKSVMRDVLVDQNGYSALAAEELIDTLEMNGFLRFLGDPADRSHADTPWNIDPHR